MSIFSYWSSKMFPGAFRTSRRATAKKKPQRRFVLERLEDRLTPSANLQSGGVVHLAFTTTEVEGTTGNNSAQVFTGNAQTNATLLDFTDTTGAVNDYTITVTWGDGSTSSASGANGYLNAPFAVTSSGGGSFHVVPTSVQANAHVYEEAASGNVFTIQVTDRVSSASTGPVSTPFTGPINVTDPAITVGSIGNNDPEGFTTAIAVTTIIDAGNTPGQTQNAGPLFFDANQTAANPEYKVTVTWGDGSPGVTVDSFNNPGDFTVISRSAAGTSYSVNVAKPNGYEEENSPFTGTVSAVHDGQAAVTGNFTVTVSEVTPGINANSGTALTAINEAQSTPAGTTIGTFTDFGNPSGTFDSLGVEYTAVINWGDGSTNTTLTSLANGSSFVFNPITSTFSVLAPAHTYAEEGSFNISLSVTHESAGTVGPVVTDTITVNDPAVTVNPNSGNPQPLTAISEGGSTPVATTVGTFTDPGNPNNVIDPTQTAAQPEYQAVITWGDGATTTVDSFTNPTDFVAGTNGTYTVVVAGHTYGEEGSYNISMAVKHDALALTTAVQTDTITVNEVQLTNLTAGNFGTLTNTEGGGFGFGNLATFVDPAGAEPNASDPGAIGTHYTATINWGDGTSSAGVVVNNGGNTFGVDGSHGYLEESPAGGFTITITVQHETAPAQSVVGQVVTITEVQLTPPVSGGAANQTINEGGNSTAITTIATFSDPGGAEPNASDPGPINTHYTATINWGDGSPTSAGTVVNTGGNTFRVDAPAHPYAEEGVFTITVTVQHETAAAQSVTGPVVTVNEVQITGLTDTGTNQTLNEGGNSAAVATIATFTDTAGAEPVANYTATINWGDGTTSAGTVTNTGGNNFAVSAPTHTYGEEGVFTVTVTVQHETASALSVTGPVVTVNEVQLTPPVSGGAANQTINEGGNSTAIATIATFTDPAGAEPNASDPGAVSTHYTATINWGDGSATSTGTVTNTGGNNFAVSAPIHTYGEEGVFTVTVTVQHETAAAQSVTGPVVTVNEVQLSAPADGSSAVPVSVAESAPGAASPQPASFATLATFTDPAGAEPNASDPGTIANNYTATINWGDGTTPTAGTVVFDGGNNFHVSSGSHDYAEEGTFTVTVTVQHETAAAQTLVTTAVVTVTEVQLTNFTASAPPASTVEGANAGPITVATFTDAAGAEPNAFDPGAIGTHYTATIDWGDGTGVHAGTVVNTSGNNFAVTDASHTFVEEGIHTLTVTVQHETAALLTRTTTYTVSDPAVTATAGPVISATEGGSTNLVLLAKFTDPAGPEALTEYDATVAWGDGATDNTTDASPNIFIVQAGPNLFLVEATHAYAEESAAASGNYTVTTTIHHHSEVAPNPVDTVVTQTAVITDPAVNAQGGLTVNAAEGATSATQTLATFTDPGDPTATVEALNDYTAIVSWGDSTASTLTSTATAAGQITLSGTTFSVVGAHNYAEEGTFNVSIRLHHGTASDTTVNSTAVVADLQISPPVVVALAGVNEGAPVAAGTTLATFNDPAGIGAETASDFAATINWGDGTGNQTGVVVQDAGGNYHVTGAAHAYAEEGTYTITVTVAHDKLGTLSGTATVTAADPQITTPAAANLPATGNEGAALAPITGIATFTDPGNVGVETPAGDFTATVVWGDAATSVGTVVSLGGGAYRVDAPAHTYVEEGTYTVSVTVKHDALAVQTSGTQTITVSDQQISNPAVTAPANVLEGAATPANFHIATFTDPAGIGVEPTSDFTATIIWGDSSANSTGVVVSDGNGNYHVEAPAHTYAEESAGYTITVTVKHDALAVVQGTAVVAVADQQITTPAAANLPATGLEGAATGAIATLATFTDPAGVGVETPAGDFVAVIIWGDATTSTGTVVSDGVGNYHVSTTGHTYVEEGTYQVTVTVKHDALGVVSSNVQNIVVSDQQISTPTVTAPTGVNEGAPISPIFNIATFNDPAGIGAETPSGDFTASIDWGDGSNAVSGTVVSDGNGNYHVSAPGHTYVEEGTYTITVSVQHDKLAAVVGTATVTAADPPLVNFVAGTGTTTGVEGAPIGPIQGIATFTDSGGLGTETTADFTATIVWNDSTPNSAGTVVSLGGGLYRIDAPSHTFAEEGIHSIDVFVSHDGALPNPPGVVYTITVSDPSVAGTGGFTVNAAEGATSAVQTVATFTDPGTPAGEALGDYTATITWGDGGPTSTGTITLSGGVFTVTGSHLYAEEGTYTVSVLLHHDTATDVTVNSTGVVVDQQLATLANTALTTGVEGTALGAQATIATFTDPAGLGVETTAADYTAIIHWGDGTTDVGLVVHDSGVNFHVSAPNHTYTEEGSYQVFITLTHDKLPPQNTPTATVVVSDPSVVLATAAALTPVEGQSTGSVEVATFTDPGGAEALGEYGATINWGDGTSASAGTISFAGGTFTVTASHTYAEESAPEHANSQPYQIQVKVTHGTAPTASLISTSATVSDPAVLATGGRSLTGVEGRALAQQTVATFTDPGSPNGEAVGDYAATITYGDGATEAGVVTYDAVSNTFSVLSAAAGHVLPEEGADLVTVVIHHEGAATATVVSSIAATDPAVSGTGGFAVTSAEGASTGTVTLATFTDPGTPAGEVVGDYSATVNWGDGTAADNGTTITLNAGVFTVTGSHTFAEEGAYNVTITLHHDAAPDASVVSTATISDPSVVLNATATTFNANEGQASASQVVATFTDPAGAEAIGEYGATVNWGDSGPNSVGTISFGGGTFTVTASHTYTEEGAFPINVTVTHGTAAPATGNTANATVSELAVALNSSPLAISATEGAATGSIAVATFTDPGGAELTAGVPTPGEYSASINWGDGSGVDNATTITWSGATQSFTVHGNHTYAEEGSFNVTVTVTHAASGGLSRSAITATTTVSDPSAVVTPGSPISALEGAATGTLTVATFTDPGDPTATKEATSDYTATINWGDSTTPTTATFGSGISLTGTTFTITGGHTYAEEGTYTVTVTVHHGTAADTSTTLTATVADQSLTALATATLPTGKLEGAAIGAVTSIATFTDPAGPEALSDYTAVVNWGDGNTSPGVIVSDGGGNYHVNAPSHTYAEEGTYTVNVTLTHDKLAAQTTPNQTIVIADQQVTTPVVAPATLTEGQSVAATGIATFTDPAGAEAVGDYTATINWGDSTPTSTGVIVSTGGGGFRVDAPAAHRYAEEGTFTITVTVTHDTAPGSAVGTAAVTVSDPSLAGTGGFTVNALEGATSAVQTVATFTDPGTPAGEALNDYTATINWGDGGPTSTGTITLSGGVFTVTGSHLYAEEGTHTVSVRLHHDAAADVTVNSTAVVVDQLITSLNLSSPGFIAQEGASIGGPFVDVATFTDPAGVGVETPAADFTAVIFWGDGNKDAATVVSDGNGAYHLSIPDHTYAEEGTYTLSVTVQHDALTAVTSNVVTLTVADPSVVLNATATTFNASEGQTSANQVVATFTDPAGAEAIGEYGATVNWGDGTTSTGAISFGGGTFTVTASHTYTEEGAFPINVTVTHGTAAAVTGNTANATVSDQQITTPAVTAPVNVLEGAATPAAFRIATFTDPAGAGVETAAADFTATINWGDGTTVTGTVVSDGAGTYHVNAPGHAYAEEGSFNITVTVKHDALAAVSSIATVSVADQQITTPVAANLPATGQEGALLGAITSIATFTDPGNVGVETPAGDFVAVIIWGDATTSTGTVVSDGAGNYHVDSPSHIYAEEGTYQVTVTVKHDALGVVSSNVQNIVVSDQQISTPTVTALTGVNEGAAIAAGTTLATFNDPAGIGAETASDFTATINWGDGTGNLTGTVVQDAGGNYHVTGAAHAYAEEGTYTLTVTVGHDKLGALSGTATVTATDPQITTPVAANLPATGQEGAALAPIPGIAAFTDPGGVGVETPAGDFTATINWGDSTTSTGTVVSLGGGKYRLDAPGHTYAEEGGYTVTVTVKHDLLAVLSSNTQSITVSDQQITTPAATAPNGVLEGAATTAGFTIATFNDPAGVGVETAAGDFTATINWGDGGPTSTGTVVSDGAGNYHVTAPAHTYAEEGSFTISVTVQHDALAAVTGTATVSVADQQITGLADPGAPATAVEGAALAPITSIAVFTDPAGVGVETAAGDFTATINWGDGTAVSSGTVVSDGGGNYHVNAPGHTYAEEGSYTLTITVKHDALSAISVNSTVAVSDPSVTLAVVPALTAVEQKTTGQVVAATFTDPGTPAGEGSTEYSATINWGDSTNPSSGTIINNGGTFTVFGSHTYAEESGPEHAGSQPYQISVTVGHGTAAPVTLISTTATVSDPAAVATSGAAFNAVEGATSGPQTLATFTDPAGLEPTTDYSATVNWGDGQTDNGASIVAVNSTTFAVVEAHTYAEESSAPDNHNGAANGKFTVVVTVHHESAPDAVAVTTTATVSDPSVTATGGFTVTAVEGAGSTAQTLATFTDPGGAEATTDYSATVNWGDGTPADNSASIVHVSGNTFAVVGSHTFKEESAANHAGSNPYTISVTVHHEATPDAATVTSTATVSDPSVAATGGFSVSAVEGQTSTPQTLATFTDPGGAEATTDYSATVTWGDATPADNSASIVQVNATTFAVVGGHKYAEASSASRPGSNPYAVTVAVHHEAAADVTANSTATVADAALQPTNLVFPAKEAAPFSGTVAGFTDGNPGAPLSDFSATINWGDGSTTSGTVSGSAGNFTVSGNHTYLTSGNLPVTVTITDVDGATTTANSTANVNGDVVITDTTGGENLTIFRTTSGGPVGNVTYILGNNPPVTLMNVHSFTYNGQGAGDTMTVKYANGEPLVAAGLAFNGVGQQNTLTIDAAGGVLRTIPGLITAGDVSPETTTYTGTMTIFLNDAVAVDAFAGPDTADRDAAFNGLNDQEHFVQAVYLAELGRAGTVAELDGWASLFNSGGTQAQDQAVIASDIQHSLEGREHLVQSWYMSYLGRPAVGGEEQGWVNLLLAGQTEDQVLSGILASDEFYARTQSLIASGSPNERYVQGLYEVLLDRQGSPMEVSDFVGALGQLSRATIVESFLQSPEFRTDDFEGMYNALLHRPDEAAGLNAWVMSNLDIGAVRVGFEATPEFFLDG